MPQSPSPQPRAPRLPPPGWMPDPSRTDIERYWDGARWTSRTRDRVTKVEHSSMPATPSRRRARGLGRRLRIGGVTLAVVAVFVAGAGWLGMLPSWVPYADALRAPQPTGPEVDYPVFGSSDLVKYLARHMVAQEPSIDIQYWLTMERMGIEDVVDAMYEAHIQNPYAFVSEWQVSVDGAVLEPEYHYDAVEAERRRHRVAEAIAQGLTEAGVLSTDSETEKATKVHDYVARIAVYDFEALAQIESLQGRISTSPRVAQSQQAYGILVDGTAVCNGYAQAFQLMADAAGLDVVTVTGMDLAGVGGGSHAWNRVWVEGAWRVVDVTWDDAEGGEPRRDYLLILDDNLRLETRWEDPQWVVDANVGMYR